jgi:NADPH:quinone reductase
MKAIGYQIPGAIDVLADIILETPKPQGRDLLVKINAVSVNPVDTKLRRKAQPPEVAHYAIDHHQLLTPQVEALGLGAPGFVFSTTHSDAHWADIVELIAPQGRFGLIDDPEMLNIMQLKTKAVSLHWEFMFTRSLFGTPDMAERGKLLNELATLVDGGQIRFTATEVAGKIDAGTLHAVHARIESGLVHGKIVLGGF